MLNALQINKNNYTLSTFLSSNRGIFEDSGKLLATSVFEFYPSDAVQLPAHDDKIVTTTVCVQIDNCFVIRKSLSISVCR